jgi:hypothetical protein
MAEKQLAENTAATPLKAEIQRLQTKCDQLEEELTRQKKFAKL